jgi:hypothetical protein
LRPAPPPAAARPSRAWARGLRSPGAGAQRPLLLLTLAAACAAGGEVAGEGQPDPTWFDLDGIWLNLVHSPQHRSLYGGRYCFVPLPDSGQYQLRVGVCIRTCERDAVEPTFGLVTYDVDTLRAECDLRSPLTTEADRRTVSDYGTLSVGYTGGGPVLAEDQTFPSSGEFIDTEYYMRCQLLSPRVMECVDRSDLDSGEAPPDDGIYRFEKVDSLPNNITCERVLHDFITSGGVLE